MHHHPERLGIIAAAVMIVSTLSPASAGVFEVPDAPAPITIDGRIDDWAGVPVVVLEDSVRVFAVTFDESHLYLMFRNSDPALARDILRQGVLIWFNADGKKKHKK